MTRPMTAVVFLGSFFTATLIGMWSESEALFLLAPLIALGCTGVGWMLLFLFGDTERRLVLLTKAIAATLFACVLTGLAVNHFLLETRPAQEDVHRGYTERIDIRGSTHYATHQEAQLFFGLAEAVGVSLILFMGCVTAILHRRAYPANG